jgi:Family of unknown function (DUF6116)
MSKKTKISPAPKSRVLAFAHSFFIETRAMANPIIGPILGFLGRLSYPKLFMLTATLFVVDFIIPDIIPFIDEILLGLGAMLLANWRKKPDTVGDGSAQAKPPIEGQKIP